MKTVLKHFLHKDVSLEELDTLTGRKTGFWTWTSQVVTVLHEQGLDVKYYSTSDLEPFLAGEPFLRKHFGKDAEKILRFTDLPVALESIRKFLNLKIFEKRKLPFSQIEYHITQGHVPLMLVDHHKLVGRAGFYQGHFVVVTGFDVLCCTMSLNK